MDGPRELLAEVSKRLKGCLPHQPLSGYNIFRILGVEAKEVIMCRFLADLLNPERSHGTGPLFLRAFLQRVLWDCPMSDTLLARTSVVTEFVTDGDRKIDIVIQNSRYFVPIEVKIYAREQEGQCFDYSQYARNAPLLYLTRFGEAPSGYSLKQKDGPGLLPLEHVRCISWSRDIVNWLTGLLPQLDGAVRSMTEQYIDTIRTIADERGQRQVEEIVQAVLASPEFFQAGLELEGTMSRAKVALMRLMFDCFKEEMAPVAQKYGLEQVTDTDYYTYEDPAHDGYYSSKASTWPALNYVVKRAKFQAEGLRLWFRIEVDHRLFAGFCLFDLEAETKYGYSRGCQVDKITPALIKEAAQYLDKDMIQPEDWWLAYCYPNGKFQDDDYPDVPNFKTMNPCAVSLVDPGRRREFVRRAVQVFEAQLLDALTPDTAHNQTP